MEFPDDLALVLELAGVGTRGTDLFGSSSAQIPAGDGPITTITTTQGLRPTRNREGGTAYEEPAAQIVVRAKQVAVAEARARVAFNACMAVGGELVNGTWYLSITPQQTPFDAGLDPQGRARVVFNVRATKRPA